MKSVRVVENGVQAKEAIEQFLNRGYTKDEVYLLAHDKNRSKDLTEALETNDVGVSEQGAFDLVANVFRSRGDELRSKIKSLGLSDAEAQQYERELDQGRVIVVAAKAG
ncbi:general stress protein [Priestia megaterium]